MAKKAKSKVVRRNKSTKNKKIKKTKNKKPPLSWKSVLFFFAIILFVGIVGYVQMKEDSNSPENFYLIVGFFLV